MSGRIATGSILVKKDHPTLSEIIKGNTDKRDNRESGFTIVEVMIVLAIAGLILAIVFIAVPALQRNSRDAQRKADISGLQSAVATYVGNNNGSVPETAAELLEAVEAIDFSFYNASPTAAMTAATATAACTTANGTCAATPIAWAATAGENKIFVGTMSAVMVAQTGSVEQHDFTIYVEGAECNATAATVAKAAFPITTTAAGNALIDPGPSRSYAIVYAVESDPNWICIDNV